MRLSCRWILLLAAGLWWAGAAQSVSAQTAEPPGREERLRVSAVDFTGNRLFSDFELGLRVRTRANRRFLGVPGLTWWLWTYRLGQSGKLGGRLSQVLMQSGETFYRQEGFRSAEVAARIDTLGGRRARVVFEVEAGPPSLLRSVRYEGLSELPRAWRYDLARRSLLDPRAVTEAAPDSFRTRGRRYSEPLLVEERRRLLAALRDAGFAAVTRDSIRAFVYPGSAPAGADSFDVVFRIRTGPPYRFGDVLVEVEGPEPERGADNRNTGVIAAVRPDLLSPRSACISLSKIESAV